MRYPLSYLSINVTAILQVENVKTPPLQGGGPPSKPEVLAGIYVTGSFHAKVD
jgi:hypothetical protein